MRMRFLTAVILLVAMAACSEKIEQPEPVTPPAGQEQDPENPPVTQPQQPQWPEGETGVSYVWDRKCMPQIRIYVKKNDWDALLADYDLHSNGSRYIRCDFVFDKEGVIDSIPQTGLRVRDNMDGMRPEGTAGQKHKSTGTQWGLSNYEVSFQHYVKNSLHTLRYVNGLFLKSSLNDPTYSRELFCYNIFREYGIWTIGENIHCRVSIHVEGDAKPAYLGVYQMIEPINNDYLTRRRTSFGRNNGFIWKLEKEAFLNSLLFNAGTDAGNGISYPYTLITGQEAISTASGQLADFIRNLNNLQQNQFPAWIRQVCDVDFLLKTYAVSVGLGMYEDFWNTGNNCYLYFCPTGTDSYKVWFIPHDYEMSLGNVNIAMMKDPGTQDPYRWGSTTNVLMTRLMSYEEFRNIYKGYLNELCDPDAGMLNSYIGRSRILEMMEEVKEFTDNDTGINTSPCDSPGASSTSQKYRLTDLNSNSNFFSVKSRTVATMQ